MAPAYDFRRMTAADPDPDNARAIRAYEKAGFRILEKEARITDWGRGQLMLAERP